MPQLIACLPSAAVGFKRTALICLLWSIAAALTWPADAAAWCRSATELSSSAECGLDPSAPFLFWKRACTMYAFNEDVFAQLEALNEREVRSAFQHSYDTWAEADCAGKQAFLVEQQSETTRTAVSEYRRDGANESVVLAIDPVTWTSLPDHSVYAVAMTMMWHNRKTGEILDTDMELNLGAGRFADCVAKTCSAGMVDLQNTVTHEAGHVLGLGHSTDNDATMAAQTVGAIDLQKRSLAADDLEGYCALELPESDCGATDCSCKDLLAQSERKGCQVVAPGVGHTSWLWWLAALGCRQRRRRIRHAP